MKKISNYILILIMLAGFSLLLYPTAANYWNAMHQSTAIATYVEQVAKIQDDYDEILESARAYNQKLSEKKQLRKPGMEQISAYLSLLDIGGNGIMGYVSIPSIDVKLPIYHTTEERYLVTGAGHLEWTSLPVGGTGTHCAISGHRGLPSARLFTDLDKLVTGDTFVLSILDETLTYEVDKISIVKPEETEQLEIVPGMDYCTLITCTPYGINSHRLLIRGHRVENRVTSTIRVSADGVFVEPLIVAPIAAVPILLLLLIILLLPKKTPRRKKSHEE